MYKYLKNFIDNGKLCVDGEFNNYIRRFITFFLYNNFHNCECLVDDLNKINKCFVCGSQFDGEFCPNISVLQNMKFNAICEWCMTICTGFGVKIGVCRFERSNMLKVAYCMMGNSGDVYASFLGEKLIIDDKNYYRYDGTKNMMVLVKSIEHISSRGIDDHNYPYKISHLMMKNCYKFCVGYYKEQIMLLVLAHFDKGNIWSMMVRDVMFHIVCLFGKN